MRRFIAGVVSAVLLMTAGIFLWSSFASSKSEIQPPPADAAGRPTSFADLAPPVEAGEKTREEKRFSRYDKDENGTVSRAEYLLSRQKAYAKLDTDGDGKLSFDEYAVKTVQKFAKADKDRTGALTPVEFATTRVIRKAQPKRDCTPSMRAPARNSDDDDA